MEEGNKPFRLTCQKLLLTYKDHLDKVKLKEFIEKDGRETKEFHIVHETGKSDEDHPYEHTHVAVWFKKRLDTKNARFFDYFKYHPNIKKVGPKKDDWKRVVQYLFKEEDNKKDLPVEYKDERCIVTDIQGSSSLEEALKKFIRRPQDLSYVAGILSLWDFKPHKSPRVIQELNEWQQELYDEISLPPDDRKIVWLIDQVGGAGKTQLAKYLMVTEPEKYYCVLQCGAMRDFSTVYELAVNSGWEGHCMIFNLSRDDESHSVYRPIEGVKDGMITTTKYRGKTTIADSAHVVVFANWAPDVDRISHDRWDIRELIWDGDKQRRRAEPITLMMARRMRHDSLTHTHTHTYFDE